MKTLKINDEKEIQVKGLKAKELGIIMNHYSKLRKKASEDEDVAYALSGLTYLFQQNKEKSMLGMIIPQVISTFYNELLELLIELFPLTEAEVDDMELDTLIELILMFLEETDFTKVAGLVAKYQTLFKVQEQQTKKQGN